jgi:hypothetical protein
MSPPPKLSRRTMTLGGIAAAGVAVITGAVYEVPRLFKHRAHGEYADLVNLLDDPDQATVVGNAIFKQADPGPSVDAGVILENKVRELADNLRARLKRETLAKVIDADVAGGKLIEADGWVIPETLAVLCLMAAP